jgi:hypothetical protein
VANEISSVDHVCCVEVSSLETDEMRLALDKSWVNLW